MTPEEKLNAENFIRRQICDEHLHLEAFRQAINRPGFNGGFVIVSNQVFNLRATDDSQDILDFAQTICRKRVTLLQQQLENLKEEK